MRIASTVSLHTSQEAHHAGAYLGFLKHEVTGSVSTPPGWDASPLQGYPLHLGRKRHCELSVLPKNSRQCPCTFKPEGLIQS